MNARAMISGESVQHWSSSQILPKIAHDVVEKCIKIFVMTSLEIPLAQTRNCLARTAKTTPTTVFQSLGSVKAQIRVVGHILPGRT